ncbi:MAG: leucyl aminopeptidase [Acidobacteria bacterium]|nr:leucyl aminopeptidase [Acidobacteriota bacterium]
MVTTPALVTWVFETDALLGDVVAHLNRATAGQLQALADAGELTGKAGETLLLHQPPGLQAQRLLLLGAGNSEKFEPASDLRRLAGTAARYLKSRSVTEFTFLVRPPHRTTDAAQWLTEGVLLANFEPTRYKTEKKNDKTIAALKLAGFEPAQGKELLEAIRRGGIIGEAQNLVRELVNEPGNRLTPRLFAERATEVARQAGLGVEVWDEKRIAEEKMGAFLSVAQGSEEPPRFVILTYQPPQARPGSPVLGLVGKGITFDSGGVSIKPSEGMEKMKYDMAGGATVLGVLRALVELKPPVKVMAFIPLTENLPSGRAQKPGDVQVSLAGKSIEVVNTDAEGRLVLADALTYARTRGCTHLIDAATLTGAIVVALGAHNVGVFSNNEKFQSEVVASARAAGEKFWPMPLEEDYREAIKSDIADIRNTGSGRGGGAITAAMFLQEFVEDTPWVHLDIAGTAWLEEGKSYLAKGPTGVGLRSLVHYVLHLGSS